ncbi:hypothetical protein BC829DRAFT_207564 [Chytridium lagenaria]|nr:hypothetical protein BC829DRAFT_207564 [Chytridium lagenaria]
METRLYPVRSAKKRGMRRWCHPKMDAREFVCKECVKGTYGRPFARRVKMDVGVQTDGGYQPMRIQSSGRIGTVDEGEVVNWMDDEHCSACEKEMGLGEKASAFVGDEGGETIKMIERDPRRFEDVYTVVFARLCNGCKVECQKRQGFLANMNEETKTLLLLQCSVRFEELAGLLRQTVTPSRLVNFFLRKKGIVVCGGGGGGVVGGLVRGPFAAGALGSVRGIPRLEAEIRRKKQVRWGVMRTCLRLRWKS